MGLLLGQGDMLRLTSSLDGVSEIQNLDNQHLEYEQFFDSVVDSNDQISTSDAENSKKELLQVMTEHKSLIKKVIPSFSYLQF